MKYVSLLTLAWIAKGIIHVVQIAAMATMFAGMYNQRLDIAGASAVAGLLGSAFIAGINDTIKCIKNEYKNPPPTRREYDNALRRAAVEWNMRNGIKRNDTNEKIPG